MQVQNFLKITSSISRSRLRVHLPSVNVRNGNQQFQFYPHVSLQIALAYGYWLPSINTNKVWNLIQFSSKRACMQHTRHCPGLF